ncbi:MAG: hypothetical protein LC808_37405, partial [Actinobacteria bacterium]|nr:hypothetical protein [Actinomycetota bacterium]
MLPNELSAAAATAAISTPTFETTSLRGHSNVLAMFTSSRVEGARHANVTDPGSGSAMVSRHGASCTQLPDKPCRFANPQQRSAARDLVKLRPKKRSAGLGVDDKMRSAKAGGV